MKRVSLTVAVALLCVTGGARLAYAIDLGPHRQAADPCSDEAKKIKGWEEAYARANCAARKSAAQPAVAGAAGGSGGGAAGGATAGSSEHSSVRGTINGGGDFIAPKLKEPPPQPRSVAPKAPR